MRALSSPEHTLVVALEAPSQRCLEGHEGSPDDLLCIFRSSELGLGIGIDLDERLEDVATSDAERHELLLPNPDGSNRYVAELFGDLASDSLAQYMSRRYLHEEVVAVHVVDEPTRRLSAGDEAVRVAEQLQTRHAAELALHVDDANLDLAAPPSVDGGRDRRSSDAVQGVVESSAIFPFDDHAFYASDGRLDAEVCSRR